MIEHHFNLTKLEKENLKLRQKNIILLTTIFKELLAF